MVIVNKIFTHYAGEGDCKGEFFYFLFLRSVALLLLAETGTVTHNENRQASKTLFVIFILYTAFYEGFNILMPTTTDF